MSDKELPESLMNFGKSRPERNDVVIQMMKGLEVESKGDSILALDILVTTLHFFILHCAEAKTGLPPESVSRVITDLLATYKGDPKTEEFDKECKIPEDKEEELLKIIDPDDA
ncbi:MAG: hypothetical protein P1U85_19130 [Verrucomicrobiales bacterium]|nr:hypothetical protein [Verrucomicrobiales bacterium]